MRLIHSTVNFRSWKIAQQTLTQSAVNGCSIQDIRCCALRDGLRAEIVSSVAWSFNHSTWRPIGKFPVLRALRYPKRIDIIKTVAQASSKYELAQVATQREKQSVSTAQDTKYLG